MPPKHLRPIDDGPATVLDDLAGFTVMELAIMLTNVIDAQADYMENSMDLVMDWAVVQIASDWRNSLRKAFERAFFAVN